jgi:CarD family transcriptional regulator
MPFAVDDWLVHPRHGVGRVVRLVNRQISASAAQLYYEIAIAKGTIWVPVNAQSSGLRKLTAKGDLPKYGGLLKSRPTALPKDHRQLQLELAELLRQGSFRARCEVVRDLTALRWKSPLSESVALVLRTAHEMVEEEWAAAGGLSLAEAAQEIDTLLLEARQAFKE